MPSVFLPFYYAYAFPEILNKGRINMISASVKARAPLYIAAAAVLSFGVSLFTQGASAQSGAYDGLIICGQIIIPSLFPFMVLSTFITRSDISSILSKIFLPFAKLFNLPSAAGLPLFLSFIAGYPVGASTASHLCSKGILDKDDAFRMMCFAVCGGPAFIIKAVGQGMLGSTKAGILLLAAHISAAVCLGIFSGIISRLKSRRSGDSARQSNDINFRKRSYFTINKNDKHTAIHKPVADAFVEAVHDSCMAMFPICGCVIIFSCILSIISSFNPPEQIGSVLGCILEVTTGCFNTAKSGNLVFISAVLGFGGLSVCCQIFSAASELKINYFKFFAFRIMHAFLSAAIMLLLQNIFPSSVPVFGSADTAVTAMPSPVSFPASAALVFMSIVFLCSTSKGRLALRRKR